MSLPLSEHLPLIASASDGIQKLRGLILELAVRGKLVPQDPNDEPASELLKRIKQERTQLEAEGVCKKSKATLVDECNWPFELPTGWKWCRFPDVANYKMGKTPPTKESVYWAEGGIPWVSISDMDHGQRIVTTSRTVSNAACAKVFRSDPVPAGTLLMSFKLTVGKVSTLGIDAFHNEAIISIFPFKGISQEYLSHFLPMIAQGGNSKSALMGDTLNSESLALLCIPLPPTAEQHRIVAKVDELMALCDRLESEQNDSSAAHTQLVETLLGTLTQSTDAADFEANWQRIAEKFDTLFTTEASINALQKTILQLAVMGKLVPQNPCDEPASKLLMQIEQNRTKLELDGIFKKQKPLPAPTDKEVPFAIPCGWSWIRLANIAKFENGDRSKNYPSRDKFVPSGIPFINAGHLVNNRVDFSEMNFITEDCFDKLRAGKTKKGDVLFCLRGSLGKFGVLTDAAPSAIASSLIIIRLLEPKLLQYLEIYFSSPMIWGQISKFDNGTAQPNLGAGDLTKFVMPLPPIEELIRIVEKIDKLTTLCDGLKNQLAESRQQESRLSDTLIQTSLKAA